MYLEKSWREGEWEEGDSKGIFYQSYQGRTCGRVKGRNKKFPVSCSMGGKSEGTKRGEFKDISHQPCRGRKGRVRMLNLKLQPRRLRFGWSCRGTERGA